MYILAIDTSCDETSVAISENDRILANVISSQVELHKKWGGVVPSIAQRAHSERIDLAINEALKQAKVLLRDIDAFAVTYGPGLAIALGVGVNKAKTLAKEYNKPLIAVNHMIGHLYANFTRNRYGKSAISIEEMTFPALALLVSGNHTEIILMKNAREREIIGATLDDAMGEAYDKVARMLNLGYPGGPIIDRLAKEGDAYAFDLPIPMKDSRDLNFSFSGLKTAVLYTLKRMSEAGEPITKKTIVNIAASFQRVAFESIILKLTAAVKQYDAKHVLLGGGVIANTAFRKALREALQPLGAKVYYPNLKKLCTDNAAMIAVAAYYQYQAGDVVEKPDALDRDPVASI